VSEHIIWMGLDVHKDSVVAAVLRGDEADAEVVRLTSDLMRVRKLFRRLSREGAVRACYEASGVGYVLQRALTRDGFFCEVVAPSLIPRKPGERRKTDRIDAVSLAKLYRSGHLTAVAVPSTEQESVRGLVRLRTSTMKQVQDTKRRINGILLVQGLVFRGTKTLWTKQHRAWLSKLRGEIDDGAMATVIRTELEQLEYLETKLHSLDAELERFARRDPYREMVEALCCLRGVRVLTAMVLVTEIGDIRRFRSPRALMAWMGLVPQERSSGSVERRGPITKTGNTHVRRILVEAGWNHRHRAGADLILKRRRQGQPPEIVAIAVKAQHRLSKKFYRLGLRKHPNKTVVAVARELCGFVWAIMTVAPQPY
jgi:transposase